MGAVTNDVTGHTAGHVPVLLEEALGRRNLQVALKRVRSNKGSPGIDGMTVDELPDHLREYWPGMREELLAGRYLIRRYLEAGVMVHGVVVERHEGTPQGGPLSPLLSNVVLDELDWELGRRGLRFVRYADDVQVFVPSERSARRVFESLTRFIERRLRLQVNREKSLVTRPEAAHFLGFCLRLKADGQMEIRLSKKAEENLASMIRALTPRTWGRSLAACIEQVNRYLRGWLGYFELYTVGGAFRGFDAHIRRRLRAIVIRQRKRDRFLYRHLQSRGVGSGSAAKVAFGPHGPWARSNSYGMQRAYSNAWFAERLVSRSAEWPARRSASRQLCLCDSETHPRSRMWGPQVRF